MVGVAHARGDVAVLCGAAAVSQCHGDGVRRGLDQLAAHESMAARLTDGFDRMFESVDRPVVARHVVGLAQPGAAALFVLPRVLESAEQWMSTTRTAESVRRG